MTRIFWWGRAGVASGVVVAVVAGLVLGGRWWVVAAVAAGGAIAGRTGSLVQAVATLALVGAAAEPAPWLVPALVAGAIATVEGAALVERATPMTDGGEIRHALAAPVLAVGVASGTLALGALGRGPAVALTLLAGASATAALLAAAPPPGPHVGGEQTSL
jgi:hypothetical protein